LELFCSLAIPADFVEDLFVVFAEQRRRGDLERRVAGFSGPFGIQLTPKARAIAHEALEKLDAYLSDNLETFSLPLQAAALTYGLLRQDWFDRAPEPELANLAPPKAPARSAQLAGKLRCVSRGFQNDQSGRRLGQKQCGAMEWPRGTRKRAVTRFTRQPEAQHAQSLADQRRLVAECARDDVIATGPLILQVPGSARRRDVGAVRSTCCRRVLTVAVEYIDHQGAGFHGHQGVGARGDRSVSGCTGGTEINQNSERCKQTTQIEPRTRNVRQL